MGGHPNPRAAKLLPHHPSRVSLRSQWVDLGQHLEGGWRHLLGRVDRVDWTSDLPSSVMELVARANERWRTHDVLAERLPRTAWESISAELGLGLAPPE